MCCFCQRFLFLFLVYSFWLWCTEKYLHTYIFIEINLYETLYRCVCRLPKYIRGNFCILFLCDFLVFGATICAIFDNSAQKWQVLYRKALTLNYCLLANICIYIYFYCSYFWFSFTYIFACFFISFGKHNSLMKWWHIDALKIFVKLFILFLAL